MKPNFLYQKFLDKPQTSCIYHILTESLLYLHVLNVMRNTSLFYFTVILLKVTYKSDGPGVYILKAHYICILCVFMNMTHVTIINNLLTYLHTLIDFDGILSSCQLIRNSSHFNCTLCAFY